MSIRPDTIAAQSTAYGPAAIGILRLSGPEAISIAEQCFRPASGKPLSAHPPRMLVYGRMLDQDGVTIDWALCTYTPGPNSYTGENTAEFQCHGAPMVLKLGLDALFAAGARQATAGEFTRRAFLNGRLDLAQAEAVGDLLESRSRESARHAAAKLSGDFVQAGKFACAVCDDPTAGKCVAQVFIGFSRCRVADVIFCNPETFCKANLSG